MAEAPRPRAGMERVVAGDVWMRGEGQQILEWNALSNDFWDYVDLNVWEVATIKRSTQYDEQRGRVILRMDADVLGKVVPGSFRLGPVNPDV